MNIKEINNIRKCVIYTRVSSDRQFLEGNGLESQEHNCIEYAHEKGLEIIKVFNDVMTGKKKSRKGLNEALKFVSQQKEFTFLIVPEIDRFMRNFIGHFNLKSEFKDAECILIDLKGNISKQDKRDDPDGFRREAYDAVDAEYYGLKNRERVMNRQKACLEQGIWIFAAPCGYRDSERIANKRTICEHEINGAIIRSMLKKLASGEITTQNQAGEFLIQQGLVDMRSGELVRPSHNRVSNILKNVRFYTGYLEYAPWNVSLRPAIHPPLISKDIAEKIEKRLPQLMRDPQRKMKKHDKLFPLVRHVSCSECGKILRSSATKSKGKSYPYYNCLTDGCSLRGKTTQAKIMHEGFTNYMKNIGIDDLQESFIHRILNEELNLRLNNNHSINQRLEHDIRKKDSLISVHLNRSANMQGRLKEMTYKQVEALSLEIDTLKARKMPERQSPEKREILEKSVQSFFNCLSGFWQSSNLEGKRMVQQLVFNSEVSYQRDKGFSTKSLTPLFKFKTKELSNE